MPVLLLLLGGWFAAAETTLMNVSDAKLRHDAEEGSSDAAQLLRLMDASTRCHDVLKACMTLCWLLGCALACANFAGRLSARLTDAGLFSGGAAQLPAMMLCALLYALLVLAFGQYAPRRMASQRPERFIHSMLLPLRLITAVFRPLVWLLGLLANGLLLLCGMQPGNGQEEVTAEDIRLMVDMGSENGAIEETEKEMIENIFEFNDRSAEDVMTHRIDVTSIWVNDDHDTIVSTILKTGLSRFPVYDEDIDDIIGILNTRDYLLDCRSEHPHPLRTLLREAYFVPETVQADTLFRDMQKRKIHMAVVVDEYGGMSGIVTMEDLLEEIVGNIYDEFDPQAESEIVKLEDNLWRIAGSASLEDIAEALDIELPLEEDYDTLGGLIFNQFTTIPADGSTPEVDADGLHMKVERIVDHRVEHALVSKKPPESEDADGQETTGKKDDHE